MNKICGNCMYFVQHYIRLNKGRQFRYIAINCGSCKYLRLKTCEKSYNACQHWTPIYPDV